MKLRTKTIVPIFVIALGWVGGMYLVVRSTDSMIPHSRSALLCLIPWVLYLVFVVLADAKAREEKAK